MRDIVKPAPLEYPLEDYWIAPNGDGPLGFTWDDKPHRLLYDLIAEVLHLRDEVERIKAAPQPPHADQTALLGSASEDS